MPGLIGGCGSHENTSQRKTVPKPPASRPAADTDARTGRSSAPDNSGYSPPVTGRLEDMQSGKARRDIAGSLPGDHALHKAWPRAIETAALSSDGKTVTIYDGTGVFLTDPRGKTVRRVRVILRENLASEHLLVSFAFSPNDRRVAILTTLIYGEPLGAFIERLWTADVATGRCRHLSEWADRVQASGRVTAERRIEGWTEDGKSVIIHGVVYEGIEMPIDARVAGAEWVVVEDTPRSRD